MNVIELTAPRLDALHAASRPEPRAASRAGREVLVRLRAALLDFLDIAVATGACPGPAFPMVPVADGADEIAELGPGHGTRIEAPGLPEPA